LFDSLNHCSGSLQGIMNRQSDTLIPCKEPEQ